MNFCGLAVGPTKKACIVIYDITEEYIVGGLIEAVRQPLLINMFSVENLLFASRFIQNNYAQTM